MKFAKLIWLVPAAALTLGACDRHPSDTATAYDPKYDGVQPNSLSTGLDRGILDPQFHPIMSTPSVTPATVPAADSGAPAAAGDEGTPTAPAASATPAAPTSPPQTPVSAPP